MCSGVLITLGSISMELALEDIAEQSVWAVMPNIESRTAELDLGNIARTVCGISVVNALPRIPAPIN